MEERERDIYRERKDGWIVFYICTAEYLADFTHSEDVEGMISVDWSRREENDLTAIYGLNEYSFIRCFRVER